MLPSKGYAPINGLQLYYEIHGNGFPLLLIHGGGSTIYTSFGKILPELTRHYRIIALEMQAHGHTADIDRPLSFQQDADDIAQLLNFLNIDAAHVFGFSNGASTTLELAIRYPSRVNRIIVASAFSKRSGAQPGFWDMMHSASFEGMPQAYKEAFLEINPSEEALYRMYERDVTRMQHFSDIDDPFIKSIQAPALIMAGDRDIVTPEHCVELYRMIPRASLAIFPGGHGDYMGELTTLQPDKDPLAALPVILRFLETE